MKKCIKENCENDALTGRRYCRFHYLERKRNLLRERINNGTYKRTKYKKTCIVCGKEYDAWRKTSSFCSQKCANTSIRPEGKNNYVYDKNYHNSKLLHRNIAERVLNRKLNSNEVVHHIDCNPKNNNLDNLLIISRKKHVLLHKFLNTQGAILKRLSNVNIENCWDNWLRETTTTWLETTGVKVIKLSLYSQSAAEVRIEQGSETMHDTSQVDEDIVQTTTHNSGYRDIQ